jgi:cytochrome b involved in lipid metabolism
MQSVTAMMDRISTNSELDTKDVVFSTTTFIKSTIRSLIFPHKIENSCEIDNKLKQITLCEVLEHDSLDDCWIIIYDRVYDITNFLSSVSFLKFSLIFE